MLIAAGNSSRLGFAKQLVQLKQQSLLKRAAGFCQQLSQNSVCVLGYNAEIMAKELSSSELPWVLNSNWEQGMGSSIAHGVNSLTSSAKDSAQLDGIMILLCDQWALELADLKHLVECWQQSPEKIHACEYQDHKSPSQIKLQGAPAIFPRTFFEPLKQLKKTGARAILQQNQKQLQSHYMPNATFDLDTQQDFDYFKQHQSGI